MARGTTLLKMLDDLRAETRRSLNPAHNSSERDTQVKMLQRVQERLWEDFAWPHLRVERDIVLQAGQRFYDTPTDLAIDRIEKLELFENGYWRPLCAGIDGEHYSVWNSALAQRSWPPRRWKISENEDLEIWPIPDQDGTAIDQSGYLKFTGIRNLKPFKADGDVADLDDRLIVLYAAGEMLAGQGAKDWQLKTAQADKHYARLRGGLTPRRKFAMFGLGRAVGSYRPMIANYRRPV